VIHLKEISRVTHGWWQSDTLHSSPVCYLKENKWYSWVIHLESDWPRGICREGVICIYISFCWTRKLSYTALILIWAEKNNALYCFLFVYFCDLPQFE
jgi:hypothetical protein